MTGIARTARLVLRHFMEEDLDPLGTVLGHDEVMRFSLHGPLPPKRISDWLSRTIELAKAAGPCQYAVLRRDDRAFLGFAGFILFEDSDGDATHELGYRFIPTGWGRGIATEAARAALAYGFRRFGFPSVVAVVDPANAASVRVLEKIGMQFEAHTLYHDVPVMKYRRRSDTHQSGE